MASMNSASSNSMGQQERELIVRRHAARLTNVGGMLYQNVDCMTAMQCLQEAVQSLMQLEDPSISEPTLPPEQRQFEIQRVWDQLLAARQKKQQEMIAKQERKPAAKATPRCHCSTSATINKTTSKQREEDSKTCAMANEPNESKNHKEPASADAIDSGQSTVKKVPPVAAAAVSPSEEGDDDDDATSGEVKASSTQETTRKQKRIKRILKKFDAESNGGPKDASTVLLDEALDDEEDSVLERTNFTLGGIPGLFGMTSKMRGGDKKTEASMLVFSEPFIVQLESNHQSLEQGPDAGAFYVPLDQASRACMFNMGLIHYQWKSLDSAVQFFQLSLSLTQQPQLPSSLTTFDPIALACLNNIGQVHLQNGKVAEAMAVFSDALSRGNSALVSLYGDEAADNNSNNRQRNGTSSPTRELSQSEERKIESRLLRRFLVRSLLNMANMHFYNCEYNMAQRTCVDAMRLLRPNMQEVDAAALWYNIALAHHHQHELHEALIYLDKFLDVACGYLGVRHLQVASGLHRKGLICFEMGNLYDSTKPMLQALRIRKANFGNVHPLVAESLCLLGKIYLDREEYRYAKNALLQALSVQKTLNEGDSLCLEMAQTLLDLGRACHSQGQLEESLKAYSEVVTLAGKIFGSDHAYVARIQNIIGNIFLENGEIERAVDMFTKAMRIKVDFAVVQNPHIRVKFSHHPTSASA